MTATITLDVAADVEAEEWLAGCAVFGVGIAERLFTELHEAHFYRPACWWVITAAAAISDRAGPADLDDDITTIADLACVERGEVRRWVETRPVAFDLGGHLQRRVVDAARRRWRTYDLLDQLSAVAA